MKTPNTPLGLEVSWAPALLSDASELSALFNSVGEFEDLPERLSPESMVHELEAYYDPLDERTMVVRDGDGAIVGYATAFVRPTDSTEKRAYVNVLVAPGIRDRGLEDSLLDWAVAVGSKLLNDTDGDRKYLCGWFYKKQEKLAQRFAARGFDAVRHWWEMERVLDRGILDAAESGFAVVPWQEDHSEPARHVYNEAFADHWGSAPMDSETWFKLVVANPNFRRDLSLVALADGEVVGYSANETYPEDWEAAGRSEGWIGGLGVVRGWRKRGIATALLARSMAAMKADGLDVAMIGVDAASPTGAQALYQSVGFATRITGTTWQLDLS